MGFFSAVFFFFVTSVVESGYGMRPDKAELTQASSSMSFVAEESPVALAGSGEGGSFIQATAFAAASVKRSFQEHVWLYSHRSCSNLPASCEHASDFKHNEENQKQRALELGLLPDHIFCHTKLPEYVMNDPRWGERYTKDNLRGRGYWFWKSAILEHLLTNASVGVRDGDWVIFVDGDTDERVLRRFFDIAKKADAKSEPDLVPEYHPFRTSEKEWTRGDVFKRFGVQPANAHYGETEQFHAQAFLMRVNAKTRRFANFWVALCADYHLISGEESKSTPDAKNFFEAREDQSLYSLLVKAQQPGGCQLSFDSPKCIHPEFGIPGLKVADRRSAIIG